MDLLSIFLMAPQPSEGKGNAFTSLLPFILILVIIYFFMIRPQSRKAKEQRQYKEQIKKGDRIITIGGVHGRILEIREKDIIIDAGNGVKLTIQKDAISMEASRVLNQDEGK